MHVGGDASRLSAMAKRSDRNSSMTRGALLVRSSPMARHVPGSDCANDGGRAHAGHRSVHADEVDDDAHDLVPHSRHPPRLPPHRHHADADADAGDHGLLHSLLRVALPLRCRCADGSRPTTSANPKQRPKWTPRCRCAVSTTLTVPPRSRFPAKLPPPSQYSANSCTVIHYKSINKIGMKNRKKRKKKKKRIQQT